MTDDWTMGARRSLPAPNGLREGYLYRRIDVLGSQAERALARNELGEYFRIIEWIKAIRSELELTPKKSV